MKLAPAHGGDQWQALVAGRRRQQPIVAAEKGASVLEANAREEGELELDYFPSTVFKILGGKFIYVFRKEKIDYSNMF